MNLHKYLYQPIHNVAEYFNIMAEAVLDNLTSHDEAGI